jgi:hypothetical protein
MSVGFDQSVVRFNPAVCVVSPLIYCGPISGYAVKKMAAFAGLDILDKILATGGYFKRFRCCEIEKEKT